MLQAFVTSEFAFHAINQSAKESSFRMHDFKIVEVIEYFINGFYKFGGICVKKKQIIIKN